MKRLFILFLVFSFTKLQAQIYQVKKGESLSGILYRNVAGKIYGPNNNLAKTLKLNPKINDPDQILKGSTIHLPAGLPGPTQWEIANGVQKKSTDAIRSSNQTKNIREELKNHNTKTESLKSIEKSSKKEDHNIKIVEQEPANHVQNPRRKNLETFFRFGLKSQSIQALETSTGSTTNLVSENNLQYHIGLRQKLNDRSNLLIEFFAETVNFSGSSSLTLTDAKQSLTAAKLVYERKEIVKKLNLNTSFGYQERIFLNSTGVNQIEFTKRSIPFVSFELEFPLWSTENNFNFIGSMNYQYYLSTTSSDYNTDAGNLISLSLVSTYDFREIYFLNLGMSANYLKISSDYLDQTEKSYFIFTNLGVKF
ncbi:MAG: hypothetical protein VX642_10800 [Bdellovibrionota bacterium]|nr:hypothetical protein [Bdellovibrionota bacterium]